MTVLSVSDWHESAAMQWKSSLGGSVTTAYFTILMAESDALEAIQGMAGK